MNNINFYVMRAEHTQQDMHARWWVNFRGRWPVRGDGSEFAARLGSVASTVVRIVLVVITL